MRELGITVAQVRRKRIGECRGEGGEALPESDEHESGAARLKSRAAPPLYLCFYELRKSAAMKR